MYYTYKPHSTYHTTRYQYDLVPQCVKLTYMKTVPRSKDHVCSTRNSYTRSSHHGWLRLRIC